MHRVLSLFSGAGGFDCGLEHAGFDVHTSVDIDRRCAESLALNRPDKQNLTQDITGVPNAPWLDALGTIDLICAGPPCQPFSMSANWHSGAPKGFEDPRAATLTALMNVIRKVQPKVVLIENVPSFAGHFGGLKWLRGAFRKINRDLELRYALSDAVLDAADFGVPQARRRFFLVADLEGRKFKFPNPTTPGDERKTAWHALWDLERSEGAHLSVKGKWGPLLPSIPPGENYLWHTPKGGGEPLFGYRTRYWSFLLKLSPDRPSWTLPAQPAKDAGPFHWENRRLTATEMARLQSFPRDWKFAGSYDEQVRQIGNAVPPLLAEVLGREIKAQLLDEKPTTAAPALAFAEPEVEAPAPTTTPVPADFMHLVGEHPPHPGHGKGPGALSRAA